MTDRAHFPVYPSLLVSPPATRASAAVPLPGAGLTGCSPIQVHPAVAGGQAG